MKHTITAGMTLLLLTGLTATASAQKGGWLASYAEAKRQAKNTGKPIMLVFRCVP
jgi:hypothetical protein